MIIDGNIWPTVNAVNAEEIYAIAVLAMAQLWPYWPAIGGNYYCNTSSGREKPELSLGQRAIYGAN